MLLNKQERNIDETKSKPVEVSLEGADSLYGLLSRAARLAAEAGVAPDVFTSAAWHAYLAASPELAERLAEKQFEEELEQLRTTGRMAKA